jgi:AcrR family transcriptional regulator
MRREVVYSQADRSAASEVTLPTRDVLINTSIPVFRARGYELTTVEDIARSAGLTTGAIYASFSSKDELFYAAVSFVEDQFEGWMQAAVNSLPQPSSVKDRLAAYLRTIPVILKAEPEMMAFRSTAWVDLARQPQIGQTYGPLPDRRRAFLVGLLRGAVTSARSSLSRADLVDVVLMAAEGIASVKIDTLIPQNTSMQAVTALIGHLLLGESAEG